MAGKENERFMIKRRRAPSEESLLPQPSAIRVLARIRVEGRNIVSVGAAPGGLPIVDLATGIRTNPQEHKHAKRKDRK